MVRVLLALLLGLPAIAVCASTPDVDGGAPHFRFRSNFWINLHHTLYDEARRELAKSSAGSRAFGHGDAPSTVDTKDWSEDERAAWLAAIAIYRTQWAAKDLLFDDELTRVKDTLAQVDAETLDGVDVPDGIRAPLAEAAAAYRAHLWPQHDATNRAWAAAMAPRIAADGATLVQRLNEVLGDDWPGEPVPVELTVVANWAGAYTSIGPDRIVVGTGEDANQALGGLEILFHESSHLLIQPVLAGIAKAAGSGPPPHRDLWHAVLFYTAGALVRERHPGYVMYAEQHGLAQRAWGKEWAAIEVHWSPVLRGEADRDAALAKLVAALAPKP